MKTVQVPADLWDEICDFINDHVDVRDGQDGPLPNDAMYLATRIEQEVMKTTPRKLMGFAAAVREYGDNWRQFGFSWNGESYRGMSPATIIAMGSRTPDEDDLHKMKLCRDHGRMFQLES